MHDDDPVGREVRTARERVFGAGLASFASDRSSDAEIVRQELTTHLTREPNADAGARSALSEIRRGALRAARQATFAMRASGDIGDDAFHQIEEELDRLEMADSRSGDED